MFIVSVCGYDRKTMLFPVLPVHFEESRTGRRSKGAAWCIDLTRSRSVKYYLGADAVITLKQRQHRLRCIVVVVVAVAAVIITTTTTTTTILLYYYYYYYTAKTLLWRDYCKHMRTHTYACTRHTRVRSYTIYIYTVYNQLRLQTGTCGGKEDSSSERKNVVDPLLQKRKCLAVISTDLKEFFGEEWGRLFHVEGRKTEKARNSLFAQTALVL